MDDTQVAAVVIAVAFIAAGLPGLAFGTMIRAHRIADTTGRLAGRRVRNPRRLARWLGGGVQVLSACGLVAGALILVLPAWAVRISGGFALLLAVGITVLVFGSQRFFEKEG